MPHHHEKRTLPYSATQLFDLVRAVDRYPEFLPWCLAARIREHHHDGFTADLVIGYKFFREKFTSRVYADQTSLRIDVEYLSGPLKYLKNSWLFIPVDDSHAEVDFTVDFAFHSTTLQRIMDTFFEIAFVRMVSAFERRAADIYQGTKIDG